MSAFFPMQQKNIKKLLKFIESKKTLWQNKKEKQSAKMEEDYMKKMLVIIVILAIILAGMIIYKKTAVGTKDDVSIEEIKEIETYITKIYLWKEITNEALPTFENINEANDTWVWEVVKKNLEEFAVSIEDIQNKAKEIFGENFTKEFPKEGNNSYEYEEETGRYFALGMRT